MVQALYEATGGDAIVTSDVGQHQMWAAQYFHFDRAAHVDQLRRPGDDGLRPARRDGREGRLPGRARSICIAGDGSVQMNMQELATCAQDGIAVKVFIMNNGYLGMVRQWQELFWDRRYSQVDMGQYPDFVKLADAYGATGMRLDRQDHAGRRHRAALATPGPGARRRARHARRRTCTR